MQMTKRIETSESRRHPMSSTTNGANSFEFSLGVSRAKSELIIRLKSQTWVNSYIKLIFQRDFWIINWELYQKARGFLRMCSRFA